jgi:hypothetical protein
MFRSFYANTLTSMRSLPGVRAQSRPCWLLAQPMFQRAGWPSLCPRGSRFGWSTSWRPAQFLTSSRPWRSTETHIGMACSRTIRRLRNSSPLSVGAENIPDEIWLIKINPTARKRVPLESADIVDRRNQLEGNISLFHQLDHIELINDMILAGAFRPVAPTKLPMKTMWPAIK